MRSTIYKLAAFCALIILVVSVFAQEGKLGMIRGKVQDAGTKEPIIEAVVTISSDAFEGKKMAVTDSSGNYRINNLPKGVYTITFEMEGYRKYTHENIKLPEGMSLGVSFQMARERNSKKE